MTITENQKNLVGKVAGIALLVIVGVPVIACAAGSVFLQSSNVDRLEANYKNAVQLHEQTIASEKSASKNVCLALSMLASAKLVEVNEGKREGDKVDLANKASQDCFIEAK